MIYGFIKPVCSLPLCIQFFGRTTNYYCIINDSNPTIISNWLQKYTDNKVLIEPDFIALFSEKFYEKGQTYLRAGECWDTFSIIVEGFLDSTTWMMKVVSIPKESMERTAY